MENTIFDVFGALLELAIWGWYALCGGTFLFIAIGGICMELRECCQRYGVFSAIGMVAFFVFAIAINCNLIVAFMALAIAIASVLPAFFAKK